MRFVKLALISILLLGGLIIFISFLIPSTIVVTRGIDINTPIDTAYKRVSDLQEWKRWLYNRDTLPLIVSTDNKTLMMGNTKVTIVSVTPSQIKTIWQVKEGQPMQGAFSFMKHSNTSATTMQWEFVQHIKWYPWEKFVSVVSEKVLGSFMEQSLKNLQATL